MSRKQLVGTTGQSVQVDGDREVLVTSGAGGMGGVDMSNCQTIEDTE